MVIKNFYLNNLIKILICGIKNINLIYFKLFDYLNQLVFYILYYYLY